MRTKLFTLVCLVLLGFMARLLPHPTNFTPIVAMALVAGAYARPRWLALALPLAAMYLSDLVLNNTFYASYYEGFTFTADLGTYVALGLTAFLPLALKTQSDSNWLRMLSTGLGGAVLFFLISNFGTWAMSGMYPLNMAGLAACMAAGLPFFPSTLASTLLFGGAAVLVMRWAQSRSTELVAARS